MDNLQIMSGIKVQNVGFISIHHLKCLKHLNPSVEAVCCGESIYQFPLSVLCLGWWQEEGGRNQLGCTGQTNDIVGKMQGGCWTHSCQCQ